MFLHPKPQDLSLARKAPLNLLRRVLWDEAKAKEVVFDMVADYTHNRRMSPHTKH